MLERLKVLGIAVGLLLLGFVAAVRMETPLGWSMVPLLVGSAWMLGDSKRLLAGYWLYAVVVEYAYQITVISGLRFGDEVLLGLIWIAIIFNQALRRRHSPELRGMHLVFWLLLILLVFSTFVNRTSIFAAAITGVPSYRPLLLGYLAYISIKPEDLPRACNFFIATLLAQLALNLSWGVGLHVIPHPGIYTGVDYAVGTMGSSLHVGYTACLGIVLTISAFLVLRRPVYILMTALLAISFFLTNTAHAYVFLAIMLLLLAVVPAKRPVIQALMVIAGLVVIMSIAILVNLLAPQILNLEEYVVRGKDLMTGRKVAVYRMMFTELYKDVPVFLLGAGPGNLTCAMADDQSYLTTKYHGWSYTIDALLEQGAGSIISHTRTGLLAIWSDMGPIAFLLYWGAHIYAIIRVTRLYRRGAYLLPWQKVIALSSVPTMALYLMVAFMTDLVHSALWGFLPWVWVSTVWTPVKAEVAAEVVPEVELTDESGTEALARP